jgi:hypothetical protein
MVCRDLRTGPVAHGRQRFSEETIGRVCVPSIRQHEVDQSATLIGSSEQVLLPATGEDAERQTVRYRKNERSDKHNRGYCQRETTSRSIHCCH